jgi:hypothetical protein
VEDFGGELAGRRFDLIPPAEDFGGMIGSIMITISTQRFDTSRFRVSGLFAAEAQRCQREGDREAMAALMKTWRRWVEVSLDDSWRLLDALLLQAFMINSLPSMRDAALALDLNGEAWSDLEAAVRERKRELSARTQDHEPIVRHGSAMASMTLISPVNMAMDLEPLAIDDLRPSLRVEQALLAQALGSAGWLIAGLVVLGSLLGASWVSKPVRMIAGRVQSLLRRSDWVWIGAGGVIGPVLIFLVFRYATPWSRLDWGPKMTLYAAPIGHFVALLLMWLTWPVVIAAWRLEKRGSVLGWTLRRRCWAGVALAAPPLAMVMLGLAVPPGGHSVPLVVASIIAGVVTLLWLSIRPGIGGAKGFGRSLQRTTLLVVSRPAWLAAMLGFAVLVAMFSVEERRWMARDGLLKPTAAMTAYENLVTKQVTKELRELLKEHRVD